MMHQAYDIRVGRDWIIAKEDRKENIAIAKWPSLSGSAYITINKRVKKEAR